MKKVVLSLVFCILTVCAFAQHAHHNHPFIEKDPQSIAGCVGTYDTVSFVMHGDSIVVGQEIIVELWKEYPIGTWTSKGTYSSLTHSIFFVYDTVFVLPFDNLQKSDDGEYIFIVQHDGKVDTSENFAIAVSGTTPNIIDFDWTGVHLLCSGRIDTATVTLDITAALALQDYYVFDWYSYNGVVETPFLLDGDTALVLYPGGPGFQSLTNFYVVVSNYCGSDISDTTGYNNFYYPPKLTIPSQIDICEKLDTTIHVKINATGTQTTFNWYANSTLLTTQTKNPTDTVITNKIYNIPYNNTPTYYILASNQCGEDSIKLNFSVHSYPNITVQPYLPLVKTCLGDTMVFNNPYATNSPSTNTITYNWFGTSNINNPLTNGLNYTITAGNGLIVNTSQPGFDTAFFYVAYNSCGRDTSNSYTIKTYVAPTILQQPVPVTLCEGQPLTLVAKIDTIIPILTLTNNWYKINTTTGIGDFTGSASHYYNHGTDSIIFPNIYKTQAGEYYMKATNQCGSVYSDTVLVTINDTIGNYYMNVTTACEGLNATLEIKSYTTITGTPPISYQWYKESTPNDILITGANTASHTITNATANDSGYYYCIMSNVCGNQKAREELEISLKPIITVQPVLPSPIPCQGGALHFEVTASSKTSLNYTWLLNGFTAASGNPFSNVYNVTSVQSNDNGAYQCKVSNTCGDTYSNTVNFQMGATFTLSNVTVTMHNKNSICTNDTIKMNVSVSTTGGYNVEWYHVGDANPISTNNNLVIANPSTSMSGDYYCKVFNSCSDVNTSATPKTVTVNPAPVVNLGADKESCDGDLIKLQTSGSFISYTWSLNGDTLSTHTPTFDAPKTGVYVLKVLDAQYCTNSDTINITYHPYVKPNFGTDTIKECATSKTLNPAPTAHSWTWSTGASTSTITVTQSDKYSVTTTGDAYGCSATAEVVVTLKSPLSVTLGEDKYEDIDKGVTLIAEIKPASEVVTYLWSTTETTPTIYVDGSNYEANNAYQFWVQIDNGECQASDTIYINFFRTGLTDYNNDNMVKIYPNPTSEYLMVSSENKPIDEISILNILGQEIISHKINSSETKIDVNNLVSGTYLIKIQSNDNIIFKKFQKQ